MGKYLAQKGCSTISKWVYVCFDRGQERNTDIYFYFENILTEHMKYAQNITRDSVIVILYINVIWDKKTASKVFI